MSARNGLDDKERKHVRTALRHLRVQLGSWVGVAKALGYATPTVTTMAHGIRAVNTRMAFTVARFLDVPIDGLLDGEAVPPGTCPHCGHAPDFTDEDTAESPAPHPASNGLKLVR